MGTTGFPGTSRRSRSATRRVPARARLGGAGGVGEIGVELFAWDAFRACIQLSCLRGALCASSRPRAP
jgi:hypothetical protein